MSDWIRSRVVDWTWLGALAQQVPSALLWFDRLLTQHKIGTVVELGTGVGTLTALFALHCTGRVITVDRNDRRSDKTRDLHKRLDVDFLPIDLTAADTPPKIERLLSMRRGDEPVLLFIDGGDKRLEFEQYADPARGIVKPGDLIAIHDCGHEFNPATIRESVIAWGYLRIYEVQMAEENTRLAVYSVPR